MLPGSKIIFFKYKKSLYLYFKIKSIENKFTYNSNISDNEIENYPFSKRVSFFNSLLY